MWSIGTAPAGPCLWPCDGVRSGFAPFGVRSRSNRDLTPNEANRDLTPNEANRDLTPNAANRDLTPNETNRARTPNEANRDLTPNEANRDLTPKETNRDLTPKLTTETEPCSSKIALCAHLRSSSARPPVWRPWEPPPPDKSRFGSKSRSRLRTPASR